MCYATSKNGIIVFLNTSLNCWCNSPVLEIYFEEEKNYWRFQKWFRVEEKILNRKGLNNPKNLNVDKNKSSYKLANKETHLKIFLFFTSSNLKWNTILCISI